MKFKLLSFSHKALHSSPSVSAGISHHSSLLCLSTSESCLICSLISFFFLFPPPHTPSCHLQCCPIHLQLPPHLCVPGALFQIPLKIPCVCRSQKLLNIFTRKNALLQKGCQVQVFASFMDFYFA